MTDLRQRLTQYDVSDADTALLDADQFERPAPIREPEPIGGWLYLLAIGLVLSIVKLILLLHTIVVPSFTSGDFSILTDVNSPEYHPLWKPLLVYQAVGNCALLTASGVAAGLMLLKSRRFPNVMICLLVANLLFVTLHDYLAMQIPDLVAKEEVASKVAIIRNLMVCVFWVPYLAISERVENTFVR